MPPLAATHLLLPFLPNFLKRVAIQSPCPCSRVHSVQSGSAAKHHQNCSKMYALFSGPADAFLSLPHSTQHLTLPPSFGVLTCQVSQYLPFISCLLHGLLLWVLSLWAPGSAPISQILWSQDFTIVSLLITPCFLGRILSTVLAFKVISMLMTSRSIS